MRAHQLAALLHQFQCIFEAEHFRRDQRRVFAEAVPRGNGGFQPVVGQLPEDLEAGDGVRQQCRLRVPGEVELVLRVLERQLRDVVAEHLPGLRIDIPGDGEFLVEVAAHARVLGALPRENIEDVLFVIEHASQTP